MGIVFRDQWKFRFQDPLPQRSCFDLYGTSGFYSGWRASCPGGGETAADKHLHMKKKKFFLSDGPIETLHKPYRILPFNDE